VAVNFHYPIGATPLDPDEAEGLIPAHITTQADLNAWEQANIIEGERWAARQKKRDILDEGFVRELHRRMFDKTWRWAGTFRNSNKNIGADWPQIAMQLRNMLDDTRYQFEHATFQPDELALRFHHRLVSIHPYPNGNGRHARLMADLLIQKLGQARFTWGSSNLVDEGDTRRQYIDALRAADRHDLSLLLAFARS